jgi:hypothetical protein
MCNVAFPVAWKLQPWVTLSGQFLGFGVPVGTNNLTTGAYSIVDGVTLSDPTMNRERLKLVYPFSILAGAGFADISLEVDWTSGAGTGTVSFTEYRVVLGNSQTVFHGDEIPSLESVDPSEEVSGMFSLYLGRVTRNNIVHNFFGEVEIQTVEFNTGGDESVLRLKTFLK